jgi:hypothetical protein
MSTSNTTPSCPSVNRFLSLSKKNAYIIAKSINQRGENAHLKSERRKPKGSSEISFDSLLGYEAVCLGRDLRTFRKNLVFPSSEKDIFCNEEICVTVTF